MYGYESWTIKKAEHRIDTFEQWCWRRLLRVPQTTRRSNQSILKDINSEYSLMLKLKLQYFWPPDVKSRFLRKDLDFGKDWRQEEKGTTEDKTVGWHHQIDRHEFEQALADGEGQGKPGMQQSMGAKCWTWLTEQQVYSCWHFLAILSLARLFYSSELLFTCKSRVTFRVNMIKMVIL